MENPLYLPEHFALPDESESKKHDGVYKGNPLLRWDLSIYANLPEGVERKRDKDSFQWQTYYRIGAQWLDADCKQALVVTPKYDDIDFTKMFLDCLESGLDVNRFSGIYDIDFEQPAVPTQKLDNVLSPLIIVHFLTVVEKIVKRGLKKGYVHREENLKKVKGRIRILANERENVIPRRFDRVYCQYNEFTVDIPENRLIKKALLFAQRTLTSWQNHKHYSALFQLENKCLAAFELVSSEIALREVKLVKSHKLFRDYDIAVNLAKIILRHNNYSINNATVEKKTTPVFWLDMAGLFEMYVYSILHEQYGDKIQYQVQGAEKEAPDFLFIDEKERLILDAKYINVEKRSVRDIIRQLAGYARDVIILEKLGYRKEEQNVVVPCIFLYPQNNNSTNKSNGKILDEQNRNPINGWTEFYKIPIPIPRRKQTNSVK